VRGVVATERYVQKICNKLGSGGDAQTEPTNQLTNKAGVAKAARVSIRTIDHWVQEKRIPSILLSPRCRRFHLPSVMTALLRFTVKEVQL
jgi:hypothetical protein